MKSNLPISLILLIINKQITSASDLVDVIQNEYGIASGNIQKHVTASEKGDGLVHIYSPIEKSDEVVDLLRGMNCRITKRCKRTRNNTEVIFEVMIGGSKSGDVYSENFQKEEIYEGKPFRTLQ